MEANASSCPKSFVGGETNNPTAMNKSKNKSMGNLYKEKSLKEVASCRNSM